MVPVDELLKDVGREEAAEEDEGDADEESDDAPVHELSYEAVSEDGTLWDQDEDEIREA